MKVEFFSKDYLCRRALNIFFKQACRKADLDPESKEYHFEGCFEIMKNTVGDNTGPAYYIALIVALVMVNYQVINFYIQEK